MDEEFTCDVNRAYRTACADLSEYEGTGYCVLHFPGEEKREHFEQVKNSKLDQRDYDFGGTVFPEGTSDFRGREFDANTNFGGANFMGAAEFKHAQFSGGRTSFRGARFSGEQTFFDDAEFNGEWTSFHNAQFVGGGWASFRRVPFNTRDTSFLGTQFGSERTDFLEAQFSGADTSFVGAQFSSSRTLFKDAEFSSAWTSFRRAQFNNAEVYFQEATFTEEVDFIEATFKGKVSFLGSKGNSVFDYGAWARFNHSRIENPEQFAFNTVLLHPGWFCNTDVRKVAFTNVKWYGMPGGLKGTLDKEIHTLQARDVESPHTLRLCP